MTPRPGPSGAGTIVFIKAKAAMQRIAASGAEGEI